MEQQYKTGDFIIIKKGGPIHDKIGKIEQIDEGLKTFTYNQFFVPEQTIRKKNKIYLI